MRKLTARWVPLLLTVDQKRTKPTLSCGYMNLLEAHHVDFLQSFLTMDESLVHHFTPEAKQQSK